MSVATRAIVAKFGIGNQIAPLRSIVMGARSVAAPLSEKGAVAKYLEEHQIRKLQIGAGNNPLDGWFNTDYRLDRKFVFLDATKPFMFDDDVFDYVFNEHMIEHIPYEAGHAMLKEVYRCLKPGGVLRLVTPDLRFLISLHEEPEKTINKNYIIWNHKEKNGIEHAILPGYVINHFVRSWGHSFIYDKETLTASLFAAGFDDLKFPSLQKSDHVELRELENTSRMPDGFLELESIVVEATKKS